MLAGRQQKEYKAEEKKVISEEGQKGNHTIRGNFSSEILSLEKQHSTERRYEGQTENIDEGGDTGDREKKTKEPASHGQESTDVSVPERLKRKESAERWGVLGRGKRWDRIQADDAEKASDRDMPPKTNRSNLTESKS